VPYGGYADVDAPNLRVVVSYYSNPLAPASVYFTEFLSKFAKGCFPDSGFKIYAFAGTPNVWDIDVTPQADGVAAMKSSFASRRRSCIANEFIAIAQYDIGDDLSV
jgi:hypothetical protein